MDRVRDVDDVTTLVLAPNASPMTLDGTNTYLVGAPGSGEVVCIDPGPDDPAHRETIEAALAARDAEVVAVLLTHHHHDHADAVTFGKVWRVPVAAADPSFVPAADERLTDGQRLEQGGAPLRVVATPGHSSDHVCFHVEDTDAVITGDHVLGRGTSVVAWPDGDVRSYVASLERLADLGARVLHPGHGPTIARPAAVIAEYIAHRREREESVRDAVLRGAATVEDIVAMIYGDLGGSLQAAAASTVKAHLDALAGDGRVAWSLDGAEERIVAR
ncbi:MAG: MBL fold metallo-hydrolase [Egibacteraceae bacterium]